MKINRIIILLCSVYLVSCQSGYRSRMVRVKKNQTKSIYLAKSTTENGRKIIPSNNGIKPISSEVKKHVKGVNVAAQPVKTVDFIEHRFGVARNKFPLLPKVIQKLSNDSTDNSEEDVIFLKQQYKKANTYTWMSLLLLLTTFVTVVGFAVAIWASLKAIRIYREYKNPGVPEYYALAWVVLILSILLPLFFLFLLFSIFSILF